MSTKITSFLDTSVGPTFLHVSNQDLTREFTEAVRHFDTESGAYQNKYGTQLLIYAKLLDFQFQHEDSMYTPVIYTRNRNDGGQALSTGLGLFRSVCLNGLYFGVSVFAGRVIHRNGPTALSFLDMLPGMITNGIEEVQAGTLSQLITDASSVLIADPIDIIGSLPQLTNAQRESAINMAILGTGRAADRPSDAWGLYNIINESVARRSRSALASANRDMGLLDDILALADHQNSQGVKAA